MVLVRVIENGESVQAEVTFPIYAKAFGDQINATVTVYRMIDFNMNEFRIVHRVSNSGDHPASDHWISDYLRGINFLNGAGVDYWTGRGRFACTREEFEEARIHAPDPVPSRATMQRRVARHNVAKVYQLSDYLYGEGRKSENE